jgi:hypothetical protein
MRTELVTDALGMAVLHRQPESDQTILHSDQGSQYTSRAFGQRRHTSLPPTRLYAAAAYCMIYDTSHYPPAPVAAQTRLTAQRWGPAWLTNRLGFPPRMGHSGRGGGSTMAAGKSTSLS